MDPVSKQVAAAKALVETGHKRPGGRVHLYPDARDLIIVWGYYKRRPRITIMQEAKCSRATVHRIFRLYCENPGLLFRHDVLRHKAPGSYQCLLCMRNLYKQTEKAAREHVAMDVLPEMCVKMYGVEREGDEEDDDDEEWA